MNPDGGRGPGTPGTQRSVAELLAAYGSEPRRGGPGRSDPEARRRRAAVVDRPDDEGRSPDGRSPEDVVPEAPAPRSVRSPTPAGPAPRPAPAAPAAASSVTEAFPAQRWSHGSNGHAHPPLDDEAETGEVAVSAASRARMMPERPAAGTATLPRERPAGLGRPLPGHLDGDGRRDGHDLDDRLEHDDDLDDGFDGFDGLDGDGRFDDGHDDHDHDAEEPARPGVREWVSFGVQVVLGAVLGALVWTGFSYLWRYFSFVALVLALAATIGLVFGVRALRGSDDVRTTVGAVVVGLLVTVSPAAVVLLLSSSG